MSAKREDAPHLQWFEDGGPIANDKVLSLVCAASGLIDAERDLLGLTNRYRVAYTRSLCNELTVWAHRLSEGKKEHVLWEMKSRIEELEATLTSDEG